MPEGLGVERQSGQDLGERLADAVRRAFAAGASSVAVIGTDSPDLPPERIEIYDNSHIQGTNALGAMVVAGPEGFRKGQYRKFNIKRAETKPGDDFAMMREVMTRRFARALEEDPDRSQERGSGVWPDLVLIDGGKGQMSSVKDALEELGIEDDEEAEEEEDWDE